MFRLWIKVHPDCRRVMYRIRSVFAVILTMFVMAVAASAVLVLMIGSLGRLHDFTIRYVGKFAGRTALWLAGVKLDVVFHEPRATVPSVYVLNHASTLDMFVIIALGIDRIRFVGKKELQYNPLFFIMGRFTGQIFIDRSDSKAAIGSIRRAYNKIKNNNLSVMMAPEGSRKHPGRIGPFKKGAFRLAIDLNYPMVPIFIENAYELSSSKSLFIKPGTVTAHIHPAFDTSGWTYETLDTHVRDVRNWYLEKVGLPSE